MDPIDGVDFILGDFREQEVLDQLEDTLGGQKVDLVLSDMAPNLSGIAVADAARIEHLCELALDFAREHLRPEGALILRSEEHTSELQSRGHLVCGLLHEKKNNDG